MRFNSHYLLFKRHILHIHLHMFRRYKQWLAESLGKGAVEIPSVSGVTYQSYLLPMSMASILHDLPNIPFTESTVVPSKGWSVSGTF